MYEFILNHSEVCRLLNLTLTSKSPWPIWLGVWLSEYPLPYRQPEDHQTLQQLLAMNTNLQIK